MNNDEKMTSISITATTTTITTNEQEDDERIHVAMTLLPDDLTAAYKEASRFVPELIEKESNPAWFLSFHPNDLIAAARRLANYWKKRKEVFQDRAFLPIDFSGNGAMTIDDVKLLQTGSGVMLPRDKKNRTVIYLDNSKRSPDITPSKRVIFFIYQCIMENITSRSNIGFTILMNVSSPHTVNVKKSNHECAQSLIQECMPIKNLRYYLIYISPPNTPPMPLFINTVYTWAVNFVASFYGKSVTTTLICSSKQDCLAKLEKYDMISKGLPVGLGGSWTGGCEPWRKGNPHGDELSLEIETDFSSLFRTTLWCHEQAVAAKHIETTTAAASAAAATTGMLEAVPIVARSVLTTIEPPPPLGDSSSSGNSNCSNNMSLFATKKRQHAKRDRSTERTTSRLSSSPRQSPPNTSSSLPYTQEQTMSHTPAVAPTAAVMASTTTITTTTAATISPTSQKASSSSATRAPSRSKLVETIEQRDARRARENYYACRKRDREKHLLEGLLEEQERLTTSNNALRIEGTRLQKLLDSARQQQQQGKEEEDEHE